MSASDLQALPPEQIASLLFYSPATLAAMSAALRQGFAFEKAGLGLLMFATAEPSPQVGPAKGALVQDHTTVQGPEDPQAVAAVAQKAPGDTVVGHHTRQMASTIVSDDAARRSDYSGSHSMPTMAKASADDLVPARPAGSSGHAAVAAVLLPRAPLGLALLGSQRSYIALATAARAVGRMAILAGILRHHCHSPPVCRLPLEIST